MGENPQKAAAEIMRKAFAAPEESKPEGAEPTEQPEAESSENQTEEPEAEPSSSETLQDPEAGEEVIGTLNSLAEALDIPIEDMYALGFKISEGEESIDVDLGTLKNFYLDNKDIDKSRQEIDNERSQLQAEQEKLKEVPPIHPEMVNALASKKQVEMEWNALEQSGLKHSAPGEYSAKAIELQNRFQVASGQVANVNKVIEAKHTERLRASQEKLHTLVPALKDDGTREATAKRVEKMFTHYGVGSEYIGMIEDPKAMHMLIEMSETFEQKGNLRKKRIDTAPKVLKPQAVQNSSAGRQASLKRLTEKARKSGNKSDQVAAVSALIRG